MPNLAGVIYRKGVQRCVNVPKSALTPTPQDPRPPVIVTIAGRMFEAGPL